MLLNMTFKVLLLIVDVRLMENCSSLVSGDTKGSAHETTDYGVV